MSEEDESREHEPSQKKLDDARARGDVVRSNDLTMAAGLGGLLLAGLSLGPTIFLRFGDRAKAFLGQADMLAGFARADGAAVWGWAAALALPVIPLFLAPAIGTLVSVLGQRALVFSGAKLAPRLSRIDPFAAAAQKFGRAGLVEFLKGLVKLLLTGVVVGWFLVSRLTPILLSMQMPAAPVSALMMRLVGNFLILVVAVTGGLGGVDYLWQRFEHLRRNRMSRQEVMEEFKESEGDPHVKSQRRQRAEAIATNRMLADVPKADVVVVNPTHYAVALKWNRKSGRAPICLAKGVDEVAARIRAAAAAAGVPVHADPPTARALYATLKVGAEIQPEHYAPVAAAIRYAENMRKRAKERRSGR